MTPSCCPGGSSTADRSLLEHTAVPLDEEVGNWQLASDHSSWGSMTFPEDAAILGRAVWMARAGEGAAGWASERAQARTTDPLPVQGTLSADSPVASTLLVGLPVPSDLK